MATITGTDASDFLVGTDDGDLVNGGLGNDTIRGLGGNDTLNGAEGDDDLDGGDGNDLLIGGTGNDTLQGGMNSDTLEGGAGDDVLRGGKGLDSIVGGAGNDTLYSGLGDDTLTGGDGADVFVVRGDDPNFPGALKTPTITDFVAGTDTIAIQGATEDEITTALTAQTTVDGGVSFEINGATVVVKGAGLTSLTADNVTTEDGIPETPVEGETFTLTTAVDDIAGTDGNDKINGFLDGTDDTFSAGDEIDGGAGTDTMRIVSDQTTFDAGVADVSNVEKVEYVNSGAVAITALDFDDDGYTSINLDQMGAADLTISGIGTSTGVTVEEVTGQKLTLTYSSVTGDEDEVTLTIGEAVTGAGVVIADVETVNLVLTGAAVLDTANSLTDATKISISAAEDSEFSGFATGANADITVTGAGDLDLGTLAATIDTVDASGSTGGVTATTDAATEEVTGGSGGDSITIAAAPTTTLNVSTGAGNDVVNLGAAIDDVADAVDGEDLVIDGGAGDEDAIGTVLTDLTNAAFIGNVEKTTNFEVIVASAVVTALDADDYNDAGIDIFSFSGNLNTSTFTVESDDTIILTGAATTDLTLDPVLDSGTNVVNLKLDAEAASATHTLITADQVETINLESVADDDLANGTTITSLVVQNNTKINITGDADLTATFTTGTELTVDGSAATGDLDLTSTGGNETITTGSGDDSVTGGAGIDTIVTNAGDDTITGGAGNDSLTGGAGEDTFEYATGTDGRDTITDFTAGTGGDIYDTDFATTSGDFAIEEIATAAGSVALDTAAAGVFVVSGTLRDDISDYTSGAQVIAAISDTGITVDTEGDLGLLILEDGGNSYVYEIEDDSGTDGGGTGVLAADITLVGIWEGVTAGDLVAANFA